jgi:hypothetical protein
MKKDQLVLFAYRRGNYEYKLGTSLSARGLQKEGVGRFGGREGRGGKEDGFYQSDFSILVRLRSFLSFSRRKLCISNPFTSIAMFLCFQLSRWRAVCRSCGGV